MLFLMTTKWNVWFSVVSENKESNQIRSGLASQPPVKGDGTGVPRVPYMLGF